MACVLVCRQVAGDRQRRCHDRDHKCDSGQGQGDGGGSRFPQTTQCIEHFLDSFRIDIPADHDKAGASVLGWPLVKATMGIDGVLNHMNQDRSIDII